MATEDLAIHNGSHRQAIETVGERLPQLYAVTSLALQGEMAYKTMNKIEGIDFLLFFSLKGKGKGEKKRRKTS